MQIEITVYGKKFGDDADKFSLDFVLSGDHSLNDLFDPECFGHFISDEISKRINYDFIILDFDIFIDHSLEYAYEKL